MTPLAIAKRMKSLRACSGFFSSAKLPQVLTTPTITQIAFPKQKVAREAFSILQEMVSKGIDGIQTVYIEPELITGASTTVRTDENRDSKKTALNPIDHIEKAISEMQTARQLCENRQILQTQRITDGKRDK